jgi:hypothetical protein
MNGGSFAPGCSFLAVITTYKTHPPQLSVGGMVRPPGVMDVRRPEAKSLQSSLLSSGIIGLRCAGGAARAVPVHALKRSTAMHQSFDPLTAGLARCTLATGRLS